MKNSFLIVSVALATAFVGCETQKPQDRGIDGVPVVWPDAALQTADSAADFSSGRAADSFVLKDLAADHADAAQVLDVPQDAAPDVAFLGPETKQEINAEVGQEAVSHGLLDGGEEAGRKETHEAGAEAGHEAGRESRPEADPESGPEAGHEAGSEAQADTRDAFTVDLPTHNPTPGHYTVTLDTELSTPGESIGGSGYGFTIYMDGSKYMMDATFDGWAHYPFVVVNGTINSKHGDGWEGRGGTNCPTDGFGYEGSFISPTLATGEYKNMSWRCQIRNQGHFIATLDVPPPEPGLEPIDAGAVADSSAQ